MTKGEKNKQTIPTMFSSEHVGEKPDFRQEVVRVEAKPPHRALLPKRAT